MKCFALVLLVLMFAGAGFAQTDVETFLKKSNEFEMQNKLVDAIAELGKAIAIQPDNADLYLRRANLYFANNNYEGVAADAGKAVGLNPDNKQVILTAAHYFRNIQQCAQSLNILNAYVFKNPTSDDVIYARSNTKLCLDDLNAAYEDVSAAIKLAPKNNMYRTTQAGMLSRLGDSEKSFEKFAQMIKTLEANLGKAENEGEKQGLRHDLAYVYRLRADTFHSKGDTTAEFADLAKFIEYSPQEFSLRQRAKIYQDHKMYDEAIADYTEAIRISKNNTEIFFLERGDVFMCAEKYDEAIKDYEQTLKLNPQYNDIIPSRINDAKSRKLNKK
jgi:tetratricopeptide (TPR) repeat protein